MEVEIDLATQLHQTRKEPERHEQNPGNCPGIVGLASYTAREKVVDIGAIYASRDKNHTVPLAPIAGAIALEGGIALVAVGKNS